MAGSRLERIGTIFSRVNGLLRTNAMKYEDRPVWYDVYQVFPPKLEPYFDREPELPPGTSLEVPNILYKEDIPRAEFFKKFGNNPGGSIRNLNDPSIEYVSEEFISKYIEAATEHPEWSKEELSEAVSSEFSISLGKKSGNLGDDVEQEQSETQKLLTIREERKKVLVTPDTLLSMFNEAKDSSKSPSPSHSPQSQDLDKK